MFQLAAVSAAPGAAVCDLRPRDQLRHPLPRPRPPAPLPGAVCKLEAASVHNIKYTLLLKSEDITPFLSDYWMAVNVITLLQTVARFC